MFFRFLFGSFLRLSSYCALLTLLVMVSAAPVAASGLWGFSAQPEISALSAVLINAESGEILFAKEPHRRLPPASTTKILTALVTLEQLDPHQRILVSPQAASAPPSRIGLRAGESVLVQDLLYGLLLKSGNDAAETLAEAAGGSVYGFSQLMNARARQIGALDSYFMNPHGLPNEDHYSTAYDLALIFKQAIQNPRFADIVGTRTASLRIGGGLETYGGGRIVPVVNHNRLLTSYEGTIGGKTGYTIKARRCFVGEVDRGGVRLIVAVLNSPNSGTLWRDARNLLDYGFARYGLASPPGLGSEPLPFMVSRDLDEDEMDLAEEAQAPLPVVRIATDTDRVVATAKPLSASLPSPSPSRSLSPSSALEGQPANSLAAQTLLEKPTPTARPLADVRRVDAVVRAPLEVPSVVQAAESRRDEVRPVARPIMLTNMPTSATSAPARIAEIRWVRPVTGRSLPEPEADARSAELTGLETFSRPSRPSVSPETRVTATTGSVKPQASIIRTATAASSKPISKPDLSAKPVVRPALGQPPTGIVSARPRSLGPVARPVLSNVSTDRKPQARSSGPVTQPAPALSSNSSNRAAGKKPQARSSGPVAQPALSSSSSNPAASRKPQQTKPLGPVARPVLSHPPTGRKPQLTRPLGPVARPVLGAVAPDKPLVVAASDVKRKSANHRSR